MIVLRSALRKYKRVLVLDDTVVVRKDAPDVFDLVPVVALGATVEDPRVRKPEEAKQSLEISCLRYGIPCNTEEAWFNSGVLVASWPQLGMVETLPPWDSFERVLHWDQGYLNAMRLKYEVPLVDLGYAFNWVGSFHSTNSENALLGLQRSSSTGRRGCSCRIWSEASTLSMCRGRGTLWVCAQVFVCYSAGAGTVLGLFFNSVGFCASPPPVQPPRGPSRLLGSALQALSRKLKSIGLSASVSRDATSLLGKAFFWRRGQRRQALPRTARSPNKSPRDTHSLWLRTAPASLARAAKEETTTASRASYAGARQLRAARDAIAAINKPRRTPPPRPDTEWATPAPASPPPCRATPRHQRAGAARRARSPTRASAWPGARASPRSA